MGADPSAFSVLGAKISRSSFRRTVPAFAHDYPASFRFCPTTGKALWTETDDLDEAVEAAGLEITSAGQDDECVIGMVLAEARDEGENFRRSVVATHRLSETAAEVKESLAKAGIEVTENNFGLWTVLYYG